MEKRVRIIDTETTGVEPTDQLVEIASELGTESGVLGSRMTGGGFGGCTVSLVRDHALPTVIQSLTSRYQSATGVSPSCFSSRPALGAHLIQPHA